MARAVGVSRADHSAPSRRGTAAGFVLRARCGARPWIRGHGARSPSWRTTKTAGSASLRTVIRRRPLRIGHGCRSAGTSLRARDRRAVRRAARGTSLVEARPLPPLVSRRSRRLGPGGGSARSCRASIDFFTVAGTEIHEVAVGPVHAGVIEPGHFRFQCHGEQVFHLEIALGYQHRGVERALVGGPTKRTIHYMETAAGDTTIGHALAYAHAGRGALEVPRRRTRAGPPRNRARARAAREPCRRSRRARGRRRVSAHRVLLRASPGRLPQHDGGALRLAVRPGVRPPGRCGIRPRRAPGRRPAGEARSSTQGAHGSGRAALGHADGGREVREYRHDRARRRRSRSDWSGRRPARAGFSGTCGTTFRPASTDSSTCPR